MSTVAHEPVVTGAMRRLITGLLAALALLPLAWLVAGALGLRDGRPTLNHFRRLLSEEAFADWLVNSLFIASAQTLLAIVLCSLAGFGLYAYRFRGRLAMIVLLAATVLVPAHVTLPGLFGLVLRLGWLDSFAAVIFPGAISAFGVFLYAISFRNIPTGLIDAARLDGCPEWRIWWSIAMPLVRPTTGAFLLLGFLSAWNNLLWPAAVLVSNQRHTLAIGLAHMAAHPAYEAEPGPLMAATLLSIVPVIGLFFLCQRDFIHGLATGSGR